MVHPQVELYTGKVDAFMQKYPSVTQYEKLKELEQKTGYPKAWFFVAGCVVIFSFVLLLGGSKLVVDVLGFVYPAYMSFKSMDTGNHKDNTQWLTYWVVFSFLSIMETLFQFLVDFIPMYYFFKIGVIIWMWHPNIKGAQTVYEQGLRPLLGPYIGAATATTTSTTSSSTTSKKD